MKVGNGGDSESEFPRRRGERKNPEALYLPGASVEIRRLRMSLRLPRTFTAFLILFLWLL
jgi:hypothetical protein